MPETQSTLPLISVIIPAHNAAETIGAALASALGQTHTNIEVVVVDDGSSDDTARIVGEICVNDDRVTLIAQANAGVASARNRALRQTSGAFVAPLDADDLWAPTKLARQLEALQAAPRAGLAYSWFRRIDETCRVLPPSPHPRIGGSVLHRHLAWNFVSNGSSILVRGDLARSIGYDERLNGGCEDYLHQLMIALGHEFVCVPEFLVGYRSRPGSLSAGRSAMERAHLAMFDIVEPMLPESAWPILNIRRAEMHARLARHHALHGEVRPAFRTLAAALRSDWREAVANFAQAARSAASRKRSGGQRPGPLFQTLDPAVPDGLWTTRQSPERLNLLERLDERASA